MKLAAENAKLLEKEEVNKCGLDTEHKDPQCGQDMLESYSFENIMYLHHKHNSKETLEAVKKFIRQYFSPFK